MSKEQIAKLVGQLAQKKSDMNISPELLEEAVKRVISALGGQDQAPSSSPGGRLTRADYPLGLKRKDLVRSATGMSLDDITLEKVTSGQISFDDIKTRPETLEMQAQVAESVGRPNLAFNLRRAAELTRIPDERILEIYNSLRPYRCTKKELLDIAEELETQYQARVTAGFVREAAEVYEKNKRLKREE